MQLKLLFYFKDLNNKSIKLVHVVVKELIEVRLMIRRGQRIIVRPGLLLELRRFLIAKLLFFVQLLPRIWLRNIISLKVILGFLLIETGMGRIRDVEEGSGREAVRRLLFEVG